MGGTAASQPAEAGAYFGTWFGFYKFGTRSLLPVYRQQASGASSRGSKGLDSVIMILPQVHLRKPCYDFTFL